MRMPAVLCHAYKSCVDALFPLECAGCGAPGTYGCPSCLAEIPQAGLLPLLARERGPLAAVWAGYRYGHPLLKSLFLDWKFGDGHGGGYRAAGAPLTSLMRRAASKHAAALAEADVIVPVALHPLRFRERGFNQAALLAAASAAALGLTVVAQALERTMHSPPRTLGDEKRAEFPTGAFIAASREVRGRRILLIDDVWTTGATMRACARALLSAGARSVVGFVLASAKREMDATELARRGLKDASPWTRLLRSIGRPVRRPKPPAS